MKNILERLHDKNFKRDNNIGLDDIIKMPDGKFYIMVEKNDSEIGRYAEMVEYKKH